MSRSLESVEVPSTLEEILEFYEARHWTDGLPIVPPTPERVEAMIEAAGRGEDELVAVLPPANGSATVGKIAVNAVMAGCRPAFMPLLIAAVEAVADPAFNLKAVQVTTNPVAPMLVVSGPARRALGLNSSYGCFGPGWRANATVGRALRLVLINIAGGIPGETDLAVLGHPAKFTCCVGENEEESPWEPLHVERGFAADATVVTAVAIQSIINTLDAPVERLAEAISFRGGNDYRFGGSPVFALNPAHARRLAEAGRDKAALKREIFARSVRPAREFERAWLDPRRAELGDLDASDAVVPIARSADDLVVIVAGAAGAGNHSLVLPSFGNSRPVSRPCRLAP